MADYPASAVAPPPGWSSDMEQQFRAYMAFDPSVRQWRNAFANAVGAPPAGPDDPRGDYNYRYAYAGGEQPKPYEHDTIPHWGSLGKTAGHPTRWMNDFMGQFGVDPAGLQAGQVTPDMQQFMRGQLSGVPFSLIPMGAR